MKMPNTLLLAGFAIGVVACSNILGSEEPPASYNLEDPLKAGRFRCL